MSQHVLFPVEMYAKWRSPDCQKIDPTLLDWLIDPTSLTARLKKHCQHFEVQVLGEKITTCKKNEANDYITEGEKVLVREVLLLCDHKAQVFARSLLPSSFLQQEQKAFANIGNQSLGQLLFNHPNLIRKNIEVATFDQQSKIAKLAEQSSLPSQPLMWGRRSIFLINKNPLMVSEVFLPDSFAYQK